MSHALHVPAKGIQRRRRRWRRKGKETSRFPSSQNVDNMLIVMVGPRHLPPLIVDLIASQLIYASDLEQLKNKLNADTIKAKPFNMVCIVGHGNRDSIGFLTITMIDNVVQLLRSLLSEQCIFILNSCNTYGHIRE